MVRMKIRMGVRMPVGIDWRTIPTPGRTSLGDHQRIIRLCKNGCANRPFYHINVDRVCLFTVILVVEYFGTF